MAGAADFRDLAAWRHAYDLKLAVYAVCDRYSLQRDEPLRRQLIQAARSAPANLAEGFGRWRHSDFARFARIAKASEVELLNHLQDACDSGHITREEQLTLEHATRRALKAVNGLIRYLDSTPDPPKSAT